MRFGGVSILFTTRSSIFWSGLIAVLLSGNCLMALPLFGTDHAPEQMAQETVSKLKIIPVTEGTFYITLYNQKQLVDLHPRTDHLTDILSENYLCNSFYKRFYFTSPLTKYLAPAVVITSLLNELIRQNYALACSIDAGHALGPADVIEYLSHVQNQVTDLRCLYKLAP